MIELDYIGADLAAGHLPEPEVDRLLALAFASAGIEDGHVAVELVGE
jgi:hypothetical protein